MIWYHPFRSYKTWNHISVTRVNFVTDLNWVHASCCFFDASIKIFCFRSVRIESTATVAVFSVVTALPSFCFRFHFASRFASVQSSAQKHWNVLTVAPSVVERAQQESGCWSVNQRCALLDHVESRLTTSSGVRQSERCNEGIACAWRVIVD